MSKSKLDTVHKFCRFFFFFEDLVEYREYAQYQLLLTARMYFANNQNLEYLNRDLLNITIL